MYEIARQINYKKKINSFIYSKDKSDFFKDKFSHTNFNFFTFNTNAVEEIISLVDNIEVDIKKTIIYIAGEASFCKEINAYFHRTKKMDVYSGAC